MPSGIEVVVATTIARSTPLALAAMGGYTSERSGIINIGLEGKMLSGACAMALITAKSGNPWVGAVAGVAIAVVLSLFHWLCTQVYKIDQIISGMAVNLIAMGGTKFCIDRFMPKDAASVSRLPEGLFYALAIGLPILLGLYVRKTRQGLRILASGSDPEKARLMGISPIKVRFGTLIATGVFCGLAGVMILNNVGVYTDNMTAGRGYIALAALILGGWRPVAALLACLLFGVSEAVQLQLQGVPIGGIEIVPEVWNCLPYFVTIIALAGFLGRTKAPSGLGRL
jgi:simple sugar transport system permease protein